MIKITLKNTIIKQEVCIRVLPIQSCDSHKNTIIKQNVLLAEHNCQSCDFTKNTIIKQVNQNMLKSCDFPKNTIKKMINQRSLVPLILISHKNTIIKQDNGYEAKKAIVAISLRILL